VFVFVQVSKHKGRFLLVGTRSPPIKALRSTLREHVKARGAKALFQTGTGTELLAYAHPARTRKGTLGGKGTMGTWRTNLPDFKQVGVHVNTGCVCLLDLKGEERERH